MNWIVDLTRQAQKDIKKIPLKDQQKIKESLLELRSGPFVGNIARLNHHGVGWRKRVGSYRIFFDLYFKTGLIVIVAVKRRTSTTY